MSSHTVEWLPDAEADWLDIWLDAADPPAVSMARIRIDQLLADDPVGNGQHLAEGLYAISVTPLRAYYTIDPVHRHVKIQMVRSLP
jgi:hypothetical protein